MNRNKKDQPRNLLACAGACSQMKAKRKFYNVQPSCFYLRREPTFTVYNGICVRPGLDVQYHEAYSIPVRLTGALRGRISLIELRELL
jgi:hypothetical protein